ncbi:hypothetical protein A0J61_09329 [Choanephora cucurbitarum]|uniref:Uncharacterized protein n=1 Tax=Choanephora cucurbitarum TaxID=101091 RepID=A0A1C7N0V0_9FUNG|nr:hypothetical protein A0J61_09329 [Choanephora cucurbitarum]
MYPISLLDCNLQVCAMSIFKSTHFINNRLKANYHSLYKHDNDSMSIQCVVILLISVTWSVGFKNVND